MRHSYKKRKLGRNIDARRALLMNLCASFISNKGLIVTTESRVKSIKPLLDKLINKAKENQFRALLSFFFNNEKVVFQLLELVKNPEVTSRNSGYTSNKRLERRKGDGSQMMVIFLVGLY